VTSSKRHRGTAYRPIAFTEHGTTPRANHFKSVGKQIKINWLKQQPASLQLD